MSRKKKTAPKAPGTGDRHLSLRSGVHGSQPVAPTTVAPTIPLPLPDSGDAAGLDREIAILRDLIRQAAEKQTPDLSLEDQLELLDTVGKAAPALARLLKARRDLANQELDPAAMLRQALLELEEEWPELKRFGEQFK